MEQKEGHFWVTGEVAQELVRRGYVPSNTTIATMEDGQPAWSFDLTPEMLQVINDYLKRSGKSMLFTINEQMEKKGLLRNGIEVRG